MSRTQANIQCADKRPDIDTMVEFYSFFHQAAENDLTGDRSSTLDFKKYAEYDVWAVRKGMGKDLQMKVFAKLVDHLNSL